MEYSFDNILIFANSFRVFFKISSHPLKSSCLLLNATKLQSIWYYYYILNRGSHTVDVYVLYSTVTQQTARHFYTRYNFIRIRHRILSFTLNSTNKGKSTQNLVLISQHGWSFEKYKISIHPLRRKHYIIKHHWSFEPDSQSLRSHIYCNYKKEVLTRYYICIQVNKIPSKVPVGYFHLLECSDFEIDKNHFWKEIPGNQKHWHNCYSSHILYPYKNSVNDHS